MKSLGPLKVGILVAIIGVVILTMLVSDLLGREKAMYFLCGNGIFIFSIITTDLVWSLMISKKQVALGTFLIVSKYLTFFVFMSVLMKQNWPSSIWLFVGFVASKILFLSGYFIMKRKLS